MRHLAVSSVGDHTGMLLKEIHTEEAIMVRWTLFITNTQPLDIRIKIFLWHENAPYGGMKAGWPAIPRNNVEKLA